METKITKIERGVDLPRVETGPIQFGDDWPGVFIRGDSAEYLGFLLEKILSNLKYGIIPDQFTLEIIRNSSEILKSCDVRGVDPYDV